MVFRYCLVLLLTVGAAGMDLRTQKISNIWLCCGWLSGLGHQFLTDQIRGLGSFAAGSFLPAALLWILFLFRMIGAGDIKLLSVLGGIMGVPDILICMIWSVIFGAVLSAAILIICGDLSRRLTYFTNYFKLYFRTGKRIPYREREAVQSISIFRFLYLWGFSCGSEGFIDAEQIPAYFAVCDVEVEYAYNFMEYLNRKRSLPFEVQAFTGPEILCEFAGKHPIEILLISDKAVTEEVRQLEGGKTDYLVGGSPQSGTGSVSQRVQISGF